MSSLALAMLLLTQAGPWTGYQNDREVAYSSGTTTGAKVLVYKDEVAPFDAGLSNLGAISVWIHIDLQGDKAAKARRSLERMVFYCNGQTSHLAKTDYDADDRVLSNWDGFTLQASIRPGSIDAAIEKAICPQK